MSTTQAKRARTRSGIGAVDDVIGVAPPAIALLGTPVSAIHASGQAANSLSATFEQAAGSNRIGYVVIGVYSSSDTLVVSGVTWGGVSMGSPIVFSGDHTSVYRKLYVFRILEASLPANGSKSIVATYGGSVQMGNMIVYMAQNAAQTAPEGSNTYLNANSSTSSINLTTVAANAWAFSAALIGSDVSASFTHGAGQVEIGDIYGEGASLARNTLTASYEEIVTPGNITQTDIATVTDKLTGVAWSIAPG